MRRTASYTSVPSFGAKLDRKAKRKPGPDAEYKRWVQAVGADRAAAAQAVRHTAWHGQAKPTLIELLTYAWLSERGISFDTQIELGFARPDFVLYRTDPAQPDTCAVWFINGDYWHASRVWHDYGKGQAMIGLAVDGVPIASFITLWERDILAGNDVFADALAGIKRRD